MKKAIFALAIVGLFTTSCKSTEKKTEEASQAIQETAKEGAEQATETAKESQEAITEGLADVPQFADKDVQAYANDLAAYYKEVKEASLTGKADKIAELQKKGLELAQKQKDLTQKLSPEDATKLTDWIQKAASAAQK